MWNWCVVDVLDIGGFGVFKSRLFVMDLIDCLMFVWYLCDIVEFFVESMKLIILVVIVIYIISYFKVCFFVIFLLFFYNNKELFYLLW